MLVADPDLGWSPSQMVRTVSLQAKEVLRPEANQPLLELWAPGGPSAAAITLTPWALPTEPGTPGAHWQPGVGGASL